MTQEICVSLETGSLHALSFQHYHIVATYVRQISLDFRTGGRFVLLPISAAVHVILNAVVGIGNLRFDLIKICIQFFGNIIRKRLRVAGTEKTIMSTLLFFNSRFPANNENVIVAFPLPRIK